VQETPTANEQDPLLTADEVATLMRVTRAWVYAETRRDALPHLRLGRYIRYRRSAIEAWLATVERGPGCPPREARR
jgi:excisionase family DNA binding protein